MDGDVLPFSPPSIQHLEVGVAEIPLEDEADDRDEDEVPRHDEDVHDPRNGFRALGRSTRPLEYEIDQDKTAVLEEKVSAEPVSEIYGEADCSGSPKSTLSRMMMRWWSIDRRNAGFRERTTGYTSRSEVGRWSRAKSGMPTFELKRPR